MAWMYRKTCMERLRTLEGIRNIKVITGMCRSDKSELMKAFSVSVARKDPSSNNVYIDLLDLDNEPLLEYHALHREIIGRHKEGARNRLFIDEVQLCEGFEKAINSIHARGGWDVYLTGSNAFLLGSDLATLFTGCHGEVHILPFSFGEYRSYFGEQGAVDGDFDGFIRRGGLAGSYDYDDISESYGYIHDVYKTILTRDLVQKFSLPNSTVLESSRLRINNSYQSLHGVDTVTDPKTPKSVRTIVMPAFLSDEMAEFIELRDDVVPTSACSPLPSISWATRWSAGARRRV
ncbi:AAA family ATPase [Atopobiaceae bacterium SGI.236]